MRHAWILVVLCGACAGKAPVETGGDGGTDGSIDTGQSVTGVTYDYFGGVALMSTTITSDGIDPPVMTTSSSADGTYALSVPIGSKLFLITARSNYRPTRGNSYSANEGSRAPLVQREIRRNGLSSIRSPTSRKPVITRIIRLAPPSQPSDQRCRSLR